METLIRTGNGSVDTGTFVIVDARIQVVPHAAATLACARMTVETRRTGERRMSANSTSRFIIRKAGNMSLESRCQQASTPSPEGA